MQVALLAMQVAIGAVQTLVATSQVKELRDQGIEPLVSQRGGASGVQPLPPDTPQMLPMVHLVWGPLMAAVKVRMPRAVSSAGACRVCLFWNAACASNTALKSAQSEAKLSCRCISRPAPLTDLSFVLQLVSHSPGHSFCGSAAGLAPASGRACAAGSG